MIVENDTDTLFILETALKDAGYKVEKCRNGSEIVEGKQQVPDLYILDKSLPLIDGLAISKYLKIKEATKSIPIIMISAIAIKKKAIQAGVDKFIKKPFDVFNLVAAVRRLTRKAIHFH